MDKKKTIIAISSLAGILLIAAASLLLYRNYSLNEFNKILIDFRASETANLDLILKEYELQNEYVELQNKIDPNSGYSDEGNKELFSELARLINQQEEKYAELCSSTESEEYLAANEIANRKSRLWLDSVRQAQLDEIERLMIEYEDSVEEACADSEGVIAWTKQSDELLKANLIVQEFNLDDFDLSYISPLKKYSDTDAVPNSEEIEEVYSKSFVELLEKGAEAYGHYYESVLAYDQGNVEEGEKNYEEFYEAYSELSTFDYFESYKDIARSEAVESLDLQLSFHKLNMDINNSDTTEVVMSEQQSGSYVLASALSVYSIDKDGKYIEADNTKALIEELTKKEYIEDSVDINSSKISYSSDGVDYTISFQHPESDKLVKIENKGYR